MTKKRLLVFLVLLAAFGVSFFFLTYGVLGSEKPPEVFNISVIVRGKSSESWESIKQGCDQAASDMNVELSFITLSGENNVIEQTALINREIAGGADAIILSASDSADMVRPAERAAERLPVVCIESPVDSERIASYITADNYAMGVQLGREIISSGNSRKRLAVVESSWGCGNVRRRMEGLMSVLGPIGGEIAHWRLPDDTEGALTLLHEELGKREADVIVTLDVTALELSAKAVNSLEAASLDLFGIGSTGRVASYIEQDIVTATIVQNDFGIGYLGVKAAVDSIRNRPVPPRTEVEHRLINLDNMYEPDNQRLLFPFIR